MLSRWRNRPDISGAVWQELCEEVPLIARYRPSGHDRLRALTRRFMRKKEMRAAGGLTLNEHMRLVVAAQACVPILNLGLEWYRGWYTVIVYPGDFVARHQYVDEAGVVHEVAEARCGESWEQGPVLLSWEEIEAGIRGEDAGSVVIHELAHKLDALSGTVNGMPPLHGNMSQEAWSRTLGAAYQNMTRRVANGAPSAIDEYAVEDPGEFFAVMSEAFFMQPRQLRESYPAVYEQLRAFYRQAPPETPDPVAPK